MSRNLPGGNAGGAYLSNLGPGAAGRSGSADRAGGHPPGEAGPGSVGVVVGRDEASRERLEGLLEAARALRPRLRAEQADTEERGSYSAELHAAFVDAGFFRILQPKTLGGLELGVEAFYQVISEVARGCPSSAWCLCLAAGHALTLASYWPEQAQREIFGEHGHLASPASFNGQPDVVIAREDRDGVPGLRISGTWKYCSGAPHSTHFMPSFLLAPAGDADAEPVIHWAVLPRTAYTVLDDWGGIIGMRGSGSHSIHIDDAFVPGHHVVAATWLSAVAGDTEGSRLYGNSVYAGPFTAFAEGEIAAIVAGLGLAAVDEYERIITSSAAPGGGSLRCEHPVWQGAFGTALALVDSAVALSARGGQWYEEFARRCAAGLEPFTPERALRLNNLYLVAENQVWAAVETMLRSAGSRHSADGARLQRYFRDMLATRTRTDQLEMFAAPTTEAHLAAGG